MPVLEYGNGDELGCFRADVTDCIGACRSRASGFPSRAAQNEGLFDCLRAMAEAAGGAVGVTEEQCPGIRSLVAEMLERGIGSMWSPLCGENHPASAVVVRAWETDPYQPLAGGGGRRFLCPHGHILLTTHDWRA